MRALYWIIGAFVSAAGGAYVVNRRAKRQLSARFLDALREERLVVEAYEPSVADGLRAEAFRGHLDGLPFAFAGQTEASGTKWTFVLMWGANHLHVEWNPLSGEAEHPLKQAYDILRRRSAKDDGLSN